MLRGTVVVCSAMAGAWATVRLTFISDVHPNFLERLSSPLLWILDPIAKSPIRHFAPQVIDLAVLAVEVFGNAAIYALLTYSVLRWAK